MHIQDPDQKSWIQRQVEGAPWLGAFDAAAKRTILRQLTEAEGFEAFCQRRYVTTKRFGLEGGEVTIPAMHAIIATAAAAGVNEIAIGMPHRGRLNTWSTSSRSRSPRCFREFGGESFKPDDVQGSGDVKYHLGTSTDIEIDGRSVHLSLQPNPSHLEAVDPVVVGKVRARQDEAGDTQRRSSVMAHPDARRRRLRRPGSGLRDPGDEPAHRLPHRRHGARGGEQPDRLHHRPGARLSPVSIAPTLPSRSRRRSCT